MVVDAQNSQTPRLSVNHEEISSPPLNASPLFRSGYSLDLVSLMAEIRLIFKQSRYFCKKQMENQFDFTVEREEYGKKEKEWDKLVDDK